MATRDFSKQRERIAFEVDGDVFEAAEAIPAQELVEAVTLLNGINPKVATPQEQITAFQTFMEMCLFPESYERFVYRMGNKANPIDIDQVNAIAEWLVEQYGMRPTEPSAASSSGSPSLESGTPLTVEPQVEELSSVDSPQPVS
jgi:hypothetical protein